MLGWAYATGDKDHPFGCTFTILGARIDLTGLERGILTIENKPGRIDHIFSVGFEHSVNPINGRHGSLEGTRRFCFRVLFGAFS